MNSFVAFLRGINVGGKNIIKMADLATSFTSLGFDHVKTYIQSGNVVFQAPSTDQLSIKNAIERKIESDFKLNIAVILRTKDEMEQLIASNPFYDQKWGEDSKFYICFLEKEPDVHLQLPLKVEKEALVLTQILNKNAVVVSLPIGEGHYGFPNLFVEKEFKLLSTARNWNTVVKIAKLF